MESTNSLSQVGDDSEEDAQESESYFFRLYSFVFFTLLELFKVQIVGLNKKYVLTTNIQYYNGKFMLACYLRPFSCRATYIVSYNLLQMYSISSYYLAHEHNFITFDIVSTCAVDCKSRMCDEHRRDRGQLISIRLHLSNIPLFPVTMTKICYGSVTIIEQTNLVAYSVCTRVVLFGGEGHG